MPVLHLQTLASAHQREKRPFYPPCRRLRQLGRRRSPSRGCRKLPASLPWLPGLLAVSLVSSCLRREAQLDLGSCCGVLPASPPPPPRLWRQRRAASLWATRVDAFDAWIDFAAELRRKSEGEGGGGRKEKEGSSRLLFPSPCFCGRREWLRPPGPAPPRLCPTPAPTNPSPFHILSGDRTQERFASLIADATKSSPSPPSPPHTPSKPSSPKRRVARLKTLRPTPMRRPLKLFQKVSRFRAHLVCGRSPGSCQDCGPDLCHVGPSNKLLALQCGKAGPPLRLSADLRRHLCPRLRRKESKGGVLHQMSSASQFAVHSLSKERTPFGNILRRGCLSYLR